MTSLWFPNPEVIAPLHHMHDRSFLDFDQQMERFKNQEAQCTQLTMGTFEGRHFSINLNLMTISVYGSNQVIESHSIKPSDEYRFCVPLEQSGPTVIFGKEYANDWLQIHPPRSETYNITPTYNTSAVLAIRRPALIDTEAIIPELSDYLQKLGNTCAVIQQPDTVQRLRSTITGAIETALHVSEKRQLEALAKSIIDHVKLDLFMAWLMDNGVSSLRHSAAFERFRRARIALLEASQHTLGTCHNAAVGDTLSDLGSKRSIEQAFAKSVSMGPLSYLRVLRLHNARRKLMQPDRFTQNIGDIAAEEGFGDQSKFSMQYRNHFGERPSDTRNRVMDRRPKFRYKPPKEGKRQRTTRSL